MTDLSFLNEKQLLVAGELERNVLLLASAGTGKTNTLSCRIGNILERGLARPEEILCLTFTNKACNEMKGRVMDIVGSEGRNVEVRTFHSFCYTILQWASKRDKNVFTDSQIYDEADCLEIIKKLPVVAENVQLKTCLKEQDKPAIMDRLGRLVQSLIGLVKEYRGEYNIFTDNDAGDYRCAFDRLFGEKPKRVQDAATFQGFLDDELLQEFAQDCQEIVTAYDNVLQEGHGIDFADIINGAYRLLQQNEARRFWSQKYKFWNVDEVQDTSRLEYKILSMIFGQGNILMCGDFFQTIYEWRGSEPQVIYDSFTRDYAPRQVVFNENYRSTRTLLDASYGYLQNMFPNDVNRLFKDAVVANAKEQGENIRWAVVRDTYFEASWIYNQLQRLKPQDLSKVCIFTRANYYNKNLSRYLKNIMERRQIQYAQGQRTKPDFPVAFMLVDEFKFFRRQEVKDVMAVMKLLVNPQDGTSLLRLIKRLGAGIGPVALERIQSQAFHDAGIRISDFLHPSTQKYNEPYEMLLRELEAGNVVVFDVESTGVNTSVDEIIQIAAIQMDIHGNYLSQLVCYVKANRSVGASEMVHHISDEMLAREGIEPEIALQRLKEFLKGKVVVGHNVTYDLTILASELTRLGMEQCEYLAFYDTLDIFRRFYPKLPNHKLEYLGDFCEVTCKSSHDALDDIRATGEILLYAVKHNIVPTIDDRRRLMGKYAKKLLPLSEKLTHLRSMVFDVRPRQLIGQAVVEIGLHTYYQKEEERVEYMRDVVRVAGELDDQLCQPFDMLQKLLGIASLSNTELDVMVKNKPKIPIITIHQAKGSEFDYVFMAGLQEKVFPSSISLKNDNLDEESRLFYVGITRAKKKLFLSSVVGENYHNPCRFIRAIPEGDIEKEEI